MYIHICLF